MVGNIGNDLKENLLQLMTSEVNHLRGFGITARGDPRAGDHLHQANALYRHIPGDVITDLRKLFPTTLSCASNGRIRMSDFPILLEELAHRLP
jgi:hypothetical protein